MLQVIFIVIQPLNNEQEALKPVYEVFNEDRYASPGASVRPNVIPSVEEIYSFMSSVFEQAQFSPECNVIALVYINRLMSLSGIPLNAKNWRPILLSALLLAQKVWDDRCLANVDFPVIWRSAVHHADDTLLDLKAINLFERKFLELLSYNVTVSSSLYAKYYFELRSLCESNDRRFVLDPLDPGQAAHLEAMSRTSSNNVKSGNRIKSAVLGGSKPKTSRAVIS